MDLLVDACQTVEITTNDDGSQQKQLMLDPEKAWWKTQIVNSPTFARFAFELKELERLATDCFNNMTGTRAGVIAKQILEIGMDYRYSIDAKSSESIRDKNNTQQTLLDKMQKNKIERAYTINDQMKKSVWAGMFGKDEQQEEQA